jgi:hypothetical protein
MFKAARSWFVSLQWLALLAACAASLVLGQWAALGLLDYRVLFAAIVLIAAIVALLGGRRGIQAGFIVWIGLFALGFRMMHPTPNFPVHPLVVLLLALFGIMFVRERIFNRQPIPWPIPRLLRVFSFFWLWGWVPGFWYGRPWDSMLAEFLNFLLILPLFSLTAYVLADRKFWRPVASAFYAVGTLIATLGSIEYLFPQVGSYFPGFIQGSTVALPGMEGFARATFAFYDGAYATLICALSLPMLVPLWSWHPRPRSRLLLAVALAVQSYGIYISGTRVAWMMTAPVFIILLGVRRGWPAACCGLLLLLGVYRLLPRSAAALAASVLSVITGRIEEGDLAVRWRRATDAINLAIHHPAGVGWSGAGWVHSDFPQVAANLGVIPCLLFLVWYMTTLAAAWRQLSQDSDPLMLGLFLCFVQVGIVLATDGVEVLSHIVLPVWFAWAMLEVRLRQISADSVQGERNG